MPDAKLTFAGLTDDQWEAWTRAVEEASRLEIAAFCAPRLTDGGPITPMRPPSLELGDALRGVSEGRDAPGQAESSET